MNKTLVILSVFETLEILLELRFAEPLEKLGTCSWVELSHSLNELTLSHKILLILRTRLAQ
jgi:hypothetical protein